MGEETDESAGEYVLGTLPPEERRAFLRRLAREPELSAEVAAWQERLAPLALAIPPVTPDPAVWARIAGSIAPRAANGNDVGLWRPAAIAATLVAAVLGAVLATNRPVLPPSAIAPGTAPGPRIAAAPAPRGRMLAALSEQGQRPGLFVSYDRATDKVTVIPVGMTSDEAHSLELWLIRGKDQPKPLWLVEPGRTDQHPALGRVAENVVFAVSREPRGGSPTGLPTGPVLYSGALVQVPLS